MAEVVEQQNLEHDDGALSPETKTYFEEAKKPEKKADPVAPETKPEAKKGALAAPAEPKGEKPTEKKPEAPKDTPEVELKRYQAAMNEERERRKEIAEQLKQESAKRTAMEERFNRFLKVIEDQEQAPPPFDKDPAGHLKAREEALTKRQEAFERALTERDTQSRQRDQLAQFQQVVSSHTQSFTKETPDYADAYRFVRDIRGKELAAIGVPDERAEGMLNQWEMQLAAAALQHGKNPAAALYAQANALGYKKAEAAPDESKKLEAIAKGQEAAKGLSSGSAPTELSLEKIMQMDEDDMASLVRGKNWNKVAKLFK